MAALAAGHRVVATARDVRRIADLESETCRVLTLDVTGTTHVRDANAEAGTFEVLVNNAGSGLHGAVEECDEDLIRQNVDTNFFGPLRLIRAALPMFREQKRGRIINISAAAAISNYPGFGIYGAPKAGLDRLSESLRLELTPLGILVTVVAPGSFRTEFIARSLKWSSRLIGNYDSTSGRFGRLIASLDGR